MKIYIKNIIINLLLLMVLILPAQLVISQIMPPVRSVDLMALNPSTNIAVGEVGLITVQMDNPNAMPINGFTAVINYDPALIQVNDVFIESSNSWIQLAKQLNPGEIYISYGLLGDTTSLQDLDLFDIEVLGISDGAIADFNFIIQSGSQVPYTEIATNGYGVLNSTNPFQVTTGSVACPPELEIISGLANGTQIAGTLIYSTLNSFVQVSAPAIYDSPTILLNPGFEVLPGITFETNSNGCN